jgi:hypothetical protein
MKRYLLFAGELYYPSGGWDDFVNSFDTIEECMAAETNTTSGYDWAQIVDTTTGKIIGKTE